MNDERGALPSAAPSRTPYGWLAGLTLVLGILLRFHALGQQSFWDDEMHSVLSAWSAAGVSLGECVLNVHGPLYLVILRGWMWLFGHDEVRVRVLSAVLGALGLILFLPLATRLVGRRAGLIALALLAASPFHLWYSQEARNYALLFDVGLLAVLAFLHDTKRRTSASFLGALLATVAGCLANLAGSFLLACYAVYAFAGRRDLRYPLHRLVALVVLSAVLVSPWILRGARETGQLHLGRPAANSNIPAVIGESPPGLLSIPYILYEFSLGRTLGPSVDELKLARARALLPHLGYLLPAAALFILVIAYGIRGARRDLRALLLCWVAVPVLLVAALSLLNLKAANSRYAFLAFPPYLLLLAVGITSADRRAWGYALLGGVLICFLCADYEYFTNPRYWKPDARAAGALLTREVAPGDALVVYTETFPLQYYTGGSLPMLNPPQSAFRSDSTVRQWLAGNARDAKRVWIAQYQSWWVDRGDRFLGACKRTMRLEHEWHFTKVPVYEFVPLEGGGQ